MTPQHQLDAALLSDLVQRMSVRVPDLPAIKRKSFQLPARPQQRQLYQCQNGGFALTYAGCDNAPKVHRSVVEAALSAGILSNVYPDISYGCWVLKDQSR